MNTGLVAGAALRSAVGLVCLLVLLFGGAGTWAWPQGWIFLVLFTAGSIAITLWLWLYDAALLAGRMRSPLTRDQLPRDRAIMAALLAGFVLWLLLMGAEQRHGGGGLPVDIQFLGALLLIGSFCGWVPVLRANSYAVVAVRVQAERRQEVVTAGPYAIVRHPMYALAVVFLIAVPLLLDAPWGLAWDILLLALLVARTLGEEAVLMAGLPGYRDYAAKVRWRLVPGIW